MKRILIKEKDIHSKFSDGLEFQADSNRIKSLGEVFTPKPVIKKMIIDLFKKSPFLNQTIFEPGSGIGNFGIEILNLKINKLLRELNKFAPKFSKKWIKEYQIRTILLLSTIYQNDIDKRNIDHLKLRLYSFMISMYYKNTNENKIPLFYHTAISNILDTNCISENFIENFDKIKFVYYFRDKDIIYRIVANNKNTYENNFSILFDKKLYITKFDAILYNNFNVEINYSNYLSLFKLEHLMDNLNEREREREAYNRVIKDLKEKFDISSNEDFKFTYCISNPPYQMATGGKSHQIYPEFWLIATKISKNISMIFPIGWQTSSGRASGSALHSKIREDTRIISVDNYYENKKVHPLILFETASTGGVNIVNWNYQHNNKGIVKFYEYGELVDRKWDLQKQKKLDKYIGRVVYIDRDKITQQIFSKLHKYYSSFMNEIVSGRNPCGLQTFYANPQREIYNQLSFEPKPDFIKFWGKDEGEGKRKWMYISKDFKDGKNSIKINNENENFYKVIWPKSGANANWRDTKVLKPKEYFTDTFINVYLKSEKQCENFISYFKTFFYRFCEVKTATDHNAYCTVHQHIPNLQEIRNPRTNKIGWYSDWTNEDLKVIFSFITEEEWKYIETEALKSDNGRK